jgi:hypothetical protein
MNMIWHNDDQQELFLKHMQNVEGILCCALRNEIERFPSCMRLLERYYCEAVSLKTSGIEHLAPFLEIQNEMCTAHTILSDRGANACNMLEYEPTIDGCARKFDFMATYSNGPLRWIEVKTIHPSKQNDWKRYVKDVQQDRFPDNTHLTLEKEWMGGELYHTAYAVRSKFLDYAIDTENKIHECPEGQDRITCLVFYSNGFDWHPDEMEDFVFYYRYGGHTGGDPFAAMEDHYIRSRSLALRKNIQYFGYFRRGDLDALPSGGTCSIKPTIWPPPVDEA